MTEIVTKEDIKKLVDQFYLRVNNDPLLSPIFNDDAKISWEDHLPKMYQFWGTQLIGTSDYKGQPFPPHTALKIGKDHFNRWLELFTKTVDENFKGLTAELAKQKARNIATIFQYKLGVLTDKTKNI